MPSFKSTSWLAWAEMAIRPPHGGMTQVLGSQTTNLPRLFELTHHSTTSAAASSRAPNSFALPSRPFVKTAEQRAARLQRDADRLAAVNGVVIPSRLKPGQPPLQIDSVSSEGRIYPCTVCRKKFARKLHVRSHFATCVRNNGNPTGARWDDAWTIRPYAPPGMRVPSAGGPLGGDSSVRDK